MCRLFLSFLFSCFLAGTLFAQILTPVKWETSQEHIEGNTFKIIFTAKMDPGWAVYSQYLEGDDGPVPTSFNYTEGEHFKLKGKNEEANINKKEGFDPLFEMNVIKYSKKAIFSQKVEILDFDTPIKGYLEYMTCDDERCLPPTEEEFVFKFTPIQKTDKRSGDTTTPNAPSTSTTASANTKTPESHPQTPTPEKKHKTTTPHSERTTSPDSKPPADLPTDSGNWVDISPEIDLSESILNPVSWQAKIDQNSNNQFTIYYKAKIGEGWFIYSQFLEGEDGPVPTTFNYDPAEGIQVDKHPKENSPYKKEGFDKIFEMNLIKYEKTVEFTQQVQTTDNTISLKGYIEYMTCDHERCLAAAQVPVHISFSPPSVTGEEETGTEELAPLPENSGLVFSDLSSNLNLDAPLENCGNIEPGEKEKKGLLGIFILGFIGGFLALLTPCVFPMIPLTVSFFTKGSQDKKKGLFNAFMYGFFIFMVYLLLSLPFHLMDSINPDILNDISTNIWLNLVFFAIFLFFAFSFFGYYELTLPASFTNKVSAAEGIGGMLGVFFMALTLALVSFSCTGPILGSLLAGALASDGGAIQLTSGMSGFGLALALPFALFAAFPGWMNSLPKSGGWLNTVKVVLGFLELALALKFLSNADLVKHWGLLKIEPFLILWMIVFFGLGLYLFGKIKFPHDSPTKKLPKTRIILGTLSFLFVLYLATGFRYNQQTQSFTSLTLLSGLAPPVGYSWVYPKDCPNNLDCFKDFEAGLAYAKKTDKPIMIDFTGHACVNCRKMEEHVWPNNNVYKHLKNDFVLISLYVDEKIELPEEEQILVPKKSGGTRTLITTGNKWAHFQTEYFNNNSQPYYVLLSPEGKLLNKPVGYTPDVEEYTQFLKCGVDAFKNLRKNSMLSEK